MPRLEELENQEELEAPLSSSSFAIAKGLDKVYSGIGILGFLVRDPPKI